jgi:hypothetical protein
MYGISDTFHKISDDASGFVDISLLGIDVDNLTGLDFESSQRLADKKAPYSPFSAFHAPVPIRRVAGKHNRWGPVHAISPHQRHDTVCVNPRKLDSSSVSSGKR